MFWNSELFIRKLYYRFQSRVRLAIQLRFSLISAPFLALIQAPLAPSWEATDACFFTDIHLNASIKFDTFFLLMDMH